ENGRRRGTVESEVGGRGCADVSNRRARAVEGDGVLNGNVAAEAQYRPIIGPSAAQSRLDDFRRCGRSEAQDAGRNHWHGQRERKARHDLRFFSHFIGEHRLSWAPALVPARCYWVAVFCQTKSAQFIIGLST